MLRIEGNAMVGGLDVLVSGASIAGPALAFWLRRAGHRVTLVERAQRLRGAGQNVDVRGPGREALRRMGLESVALERRTGELGIRFVDDDDVSLAEFPAGQDDSSGATAQLEILRGVLSAIIVDAGASGVECRPGSKSVTTNGTANPSEVCTVPVACKASSVYGGSSRARLIVGPHFGHASRSTRTAQTADDGAVINLSTASTMRRYPYCLGCTPAT
ncbi:hypothetical protein [Mycobacterium sp.]|uniref:hypothetical protein n=1 Tax=Mycobacterium sp. TaxID=1785 RepID=UPI003F9BEAE8